LVKRSFGRTPGVLACGNLAGASGKGKRTINIWKNSVQNHVTFFAKLPK